VTALGAEAQIQRAAVGLCAELILLVAADSIYEFQWDLREYSWISPFAFLWTYAIALGLALKSAKTTSEFLERRNERRAARQPSDFSS